MEKNLCPSPGIEPESYYFPVLDTTAELFDWYNKILKLYISNNKGYLLNLEKMSLNGIPSYTYIKRILYVQVSTRNSYKFLRILDVYYTYFFRREWLKKMTPKLFED